LIEIEPNEIGVYILEEVLVISHSAFHLLYPLCLKIILSKEHKLKNIASKIILFLNADHNTAWNIRFSLLNENPDYIDQELKFTQVLATYFKDTQIPYIMRLKLIKMKKIDLESFLTLESEFFL
jgi:hypothetical protein